MQYRICGVVSLDASGIFWRRLIAMISGSSALPKDAAQQELSGSTAGVVNHHEPLEKQQQNSLYAA
jgi:hypothetical protein